MTLTTPPDRRLEAALAQLGPVAGSPLSAIPPVAMPMQMGLDARSWIVNTEAGSLFLRLFDGAVPLAQARDLAGQAATQAAAAGIAPALALTDPEIGMQAYEYRAAPWHMAMRPDFDADEIQLGAVETLRRWHATAPLARPFGRLAELSALMASCEELARNSDRRGAALPAVWPRLRAGARQASAALAALDFDPAPVHGEIVASNFLLDGAGSVQLVDFDRAGTGDPASDIAALALEICPDAVSTEALLDAAFGAVNDDMRHRILLWQVIEDLYWGCWLRLAHFVSPLSQTVEFYKLGTLRLDRALSRMTQEAAPLLDGRRAA